MAMAAAVPSPGRRTVPQATEVITASPTAGESHDHFRRPHARNTACPTQTEAMRMAAKEAYVPSIGRRA